MLLSLVALAGCTVPSLQGAFGPLAPAQQEPVLPAQTLNPSPPPPPPPTAKTVEQFDTTSEDDRAAAVAVTVAALETDLGLTIASLGPPAEPGIWLKTPLVTSLSEGRITYQGTSVNVELRPSGGAAGSGSQISLAAMRLLGVPLTSLPELRVFLR
jgi:hypothetical protein